MGAKRNKRKALINRQSIDGKLTCFYCDIQINRENVSIDHIVARKKGGTLRRENTVCSCSDCNNEKSNKPPQKWAKELRKRGISDARIDSYMIFARNKVPPYHKGFDIK